MERDFIAHHGIKGQKWGVRRYQYADGTLTPAGKIKYGIDLHKEIKGYKTSTKANYEKAKQEYKDFRKSRIRDPENKAKLKSRVKQTKEDKRIARALTKNKYKSVYFKTRDPQKKQAVKEMILKDDKFNRAIRKTAITAVGLKAVGKAVKWGTITSIVMSKDPEAGKKIVEKMFEEGKLNKSLKHSELELYHHGIKGQKWGIRRYQNEDGTLTAAGRKRYGVDKINQNPKRIASSFGYGEYYNLHKDIREAIKKENKNASKEEIEQKIKEAYKYVYPTHTDLHYSVGRSVYNDASNVLTDIAYIPGLSEKKMYDIVSYRKYAKQLIEEMKKDKRI